MKPLMKLSVNKFLHKLIVIGLPAVLLLVAGCSTPPPATPPDIQGQVGTSVAATLAALPTNTSEPPGVDATTTAIAATPSPEPTATETPTLPPTETPAPTSTPLPSLTPTRVPGDPVANLGQPQWRASFDDNNPNWFTFEDEQTKVEIKDGKLILTSLKANNFEAWSLTAPVLDDFYLEIKGAFGECSQKDRYGLFFRGPDPNEGYLFGISCDGFFRLRKWDGEQMTQLVNWTRSDIINTGDGGVNRLGIWAEGDRISAYVNGQFLVEVQDDAYEAGRFGAFVSADITPGFTAEISEAAYWDLP